MNSDTLAVAIAIATKKAGKAAEKAEAAQAAANEALSKVEAISTAVYMGSDGLFYVNTEEE